MPLTAVEAASRTPVTLLTGFLGSGKTTVLNHVLKQPEMAATAVIVNEFGEIGIDHLLVEKATDDVVLMQSGCLCCTIRGDIAETLVNLFVDRAKGRIPGFERVVIETTGLADPAPILHALMQDPIVAERYMVDGVVATIDAVNGAATLDAQLEAVKQAAVADRLLLTKCDLASAEGRRELEARLAALNPGAPLIEVTAGTVDPSFLFNLGLFDPETKTVEVQRWLGEDLAGGDDHGHNAHDHGHVRRHAQDVNRHDAHISSFCITRDRPLSWTALSGWLDALASMRGSDLLRMKAIVAIEERPGQPVVLHGVQHLFHPPVLLPEWPSDDHRTRIVFITRDLPRDKIEESLAAYVDAEPATLSPPPC
ncbi:MAG TPA: GTP-binding protein [Stellaceae bacterium]|jgi:G3E family GTPase|nr:GTP-binding protein [Stellaceae bacterium]